MMNIKMKLDWVIPMCITGSHNAFTDLCLFKEELYCCFRQALNHVSDDGTINIFTLNVEGKVIARNRIRQENCDLRDPKISLTPDGKLMLIAYARSIQVEGQTRPAKNLCWISADGRSWSSAKSFAANNWWLWRVRWHKSQAYGFAYNRSANAIDFYKGDPRRTFQKHVRSALSLQTHQLAYPNESDMTFIDNCCFAIVRRDADSYSAQLGHSKFPYKHWKWLDLRFYLGGPVMQAVNNELALVAGRVIHKNKLVTAVFILQLSSGIVIQKLFLPSGGDNSYPGMVVIGQTLYLSYYSSHVDNKSQIYLAKISL
ncbi:hypothetical protein [Paraglaciecola sp.]|uniref:hypothetical protein n=1 Tax=Paraglaciecola sp. TaxID=1920173 RepID=UPI00273DF1A3|nr:hypothetical protein [Paraglaciecola sp.]MDP5032919.1 hypothetical protein [Paraglaciecola sp.]